MFTFALTYHQVMPSFLDFVFPFGRTLYAQDFHFSGFRHGDRLAELDRGTPMPQIGRSGRDIRLCYNLKSVEGSRNNWPWSIRHAAVHHSFDVENGQATWIVIKGNKLLKERMTNASASLLQSDAHSFTDVVRAFSSALKLHLVLCNWSAEKWRWYINYLEDELQKITRRAVSVEVTRSPPPLPKSPSNQTTSTPAMSMIQSVAKTVRAEGYSLNPLPAVAAPPSPSTPRKPPQLPPDLPVPDEESQEVRGDHQFTFGDLQRTQFIEEKANEALLVLKSNSNILIELKQHYASLDNCDDLPVGLRHDCRGFIARFQKRVTSIENDMRMHQSRIETLLRLLENRKNLVSLNVMSISESANPCAVIRDPRLSKDGSKSEICRKGSVIRR